jgi:two-component system heavy metal sensor histidine kinase CusS
VPANIRAGGAIAYNKHLGHDGAVMFDHACRMGVSGVLRSENATEPSQCEMINIGKELAAVHEFFEAAAAERDVSLRVSDESDLWVSIDKILFQQAVGNLVSNAIAHTLKGGIVQIAARADASGLRVSVTDTGCGIAAEHLPHVFDRFYRVDRARSASEHSEHNVGLGLAMVKSIVTRHGGRIEIDSEVGRGTQVTLIFPRPD